MNHVTPAASVPNRKSIWRDRPDARVFSVFDRDRRGRGCWIDETIARAELTKRHGGYMLVMDEYHGKLTAYGHVKRIVVDVVRGSAVAS